MFESITACPSCKSKDFANDMIIEDHFLTHESFALSKCNNCELKFTNPRPTQEQIGKYYDSSEYLSHSKSFSPIGIAYQLVKRISLNYKEGIISKTYPDPPGTILDIGTGTGEFLDHMQKRKWEIHGMEPNPNALKNAQSNVRPKIVPDLDSLPTKQKYDVITLWHVLEHIHDLQDMISFIGQRVKKKGRVYLALPNYESYDAKKFKEHWAAYDVPRHLYHFNRRAVKHLASDHGFKVKNILPLKFDSYYISLISNQYKYGSKKPLKSIITGWKSNSYAKNNLLNYSSLIYVLKKK